MPLWQENCVGLSEGNSNVHHRSSSSSFNHRLRQSDALRQGSRTRCGPSLNRREQQTDGRNGTTSSGFASSRLSSLVSLSESFCSASANFFQHELKPLWLSVKVEAASDESLLFFSVSLSFSLSTCFFFPDLYSSLCHFVKASWKSWSGMQVLNIDRLASSLQSKVP